jgi:MFS family permease
MIQTTSYAVISILYAKDQQKYLGIMEASVAFGCLFGPVVGSFLYNLVAFDGTLYIIGGLFIVLLPLLIKVIPSSVDTKEEIVASKNDKDKDEIEDVTEDSVEEVLIPVTYAKLFCNKFYSMTAIAAFFAYFNY